MRGALTARAVACYFLAATLALAVASCGSSSSTNSNSVLGKTPRSMPTTGLPSNRRRNRALPSAAPGTNASGAGPIGSILGYGSPASGAEEAAVSVAARSFLTALGARDYTGICASLGIRYLAPLQAFINKNSKGNGCVAVLKKLLVSPQITTTAQKEAHASISSVRVKGDTAFVIFNSPGIRRRFFVVKRQKGTWKATSLAPGLPLPR